jgi:C-terminal processing protease CtpA/Prc
VKTQKKEKAVPVVISKGNPNPPKLTLLVDASTRGAAEIFALALSKFAGATLSGASTGHERSVLETVPLPDGSGYCLVTGEYVVSTGATK